MLAEVPDRDQCVDLVAAALCAAELSPGAWLFATADRRQVYRREASDLLAQLDACAVARARAPRDGWASAG